MLEPFGDFVVSVSKDFSADLEGISNALNEYSWSGDNVKWGVFENRWGVHLMTDTSEFSIIQPIPTLYPEVITAVYVEREDGETVFIENPTDEDVEFAHEFVFEVAPLRQLAEKVAPFVDTGCFEISCWINENHRGLCLERMKFYADGRAERCRTVSGLSTSYENKLELIWP